MRRTVFYFTDCAQGDPNATSRLQLELAERFIDEDVEPLLFVHGVRDDLEAGFCAADLLGRARRPTVIILNAAPRHDTDRRRPGWQNGSPFGYYRFGDHLVVGTISGFAFSCLQAKLGKPIVVERMTITEVAPYLTDDPAERQRLAKSQFRSLDFLIPAAAKLARGVKLPSESWSKVPELGRRVLFCDRPFGNAKLSVTYEELAELGIDLRRPINITLDGKTTLTVNFYPGGLTTLPEEPNHVGLTVGSSGWIRDGIHLLELQVKGGSAAAVLGLKGGEVATFKQS